MGIIALAISMHKNSRTQPGRLLQIFFIVVLSDFITQELANTAWAFATDFLALAILAAATSQRSNSRIPRGRLRQSIIALAISMHKNSRTQRGRLLQIFFIVVLSYFITQ